MTNPDKLASVRVELGLLRTESGKVDVSSELISIINELRSVNERLWDIEDRIRDKERAKSFDDEFVELARSVYKTNDRRADLKRQINELLGSQIREEKSYQGY